MKIFKYFILLNICFAEKIKVAYFPGYSNKYSVSEFNAENITHIMYSFAIPGPEGKGIYPDGEYFPPEQDEKLNELIEKAHKSNTNVLVSFGGYSGSRYISNIVKDSNLKNRFINSILKLVGKFDLDGVDIDWEYPGREGRKCNIFDPKNDMNNFINFLKELRIKFDNTSSKSNKFNKKLKSRKLITAAVHVSPFKEDETRNINKSLVENLDYIMVMAYDINGKWSKTPGANAPLKGPLSFESSIKDWIATGIPKEKIVMGLSFYGRSMYVKKIIDEESSNTLKNYVVEKDEIKGDKDDVKEPPEINDCNIEDGVYSPKSYTSTESLNLPGYQYSGIWKYKNIKSNILNKNNNPWVASFDEESKTPYLLKKNDKKVVFMSYEDANSIKEKTRLIQDNQLGGFMIWNLEQDDTDMELRRAASSGISDSSIKDSIAY